MILPNPSNADETYVFSREEYAVISIRRGMFVMLRTATKINIMHVQIYQIAIYIYLFIYLFFESINVCLGVQNPM